MLLCDSPNKSGNGRSFGLGGHSLVGVSRFQPVLFSAGSGFTPGTSPHALTAAQLWVSRDPARDSPPPPHTTRPKLWGALEPGGDLGCLSGAETIQTFPGCYCLTQQPGLQGDPQEPGSSPRTEPCPQLTPSASAKPSQAFLHLIPARQLSLGRD